MLSAHCVLGRTSPDDQRSIFARKEPKVRVSETQLVRAVLRVFVRRHGRKQTNKRICVSSRRHRQAVSKRPCVAQVAPSRSLSSYSTSEDRKMFIFTFSSSYHCITLFFSRFFPGQSESGPLFKNEYTPPFNNLSCVNKSSS